MLTEEADDNESDSSSSSYAYDDEAARGILGAYLQLGEEDDDDGEASSSALEALDVAGLRARLRGVVAEAAVAARERRAVEARRALSLSSLASSLSRSGVGGEEALEPSDHAAAAAGAVEEEEGDGDDDSLMEQHGEALDFLVQLLPEGTDPRVVAFAFRVKCLFDRDQAADLLLQVAGEEGAMAALEAERVRVWVDAGCGEWWWLTGVGCHHGLEQAKCEASRREAKEARRREQEAAEAAARKVCVTSDIKAPSSLSIHSPI